jgi:hypothetical protein
VSKSVFEPPVILRIVPELGKHHFVAGTLGLVVEVEVVGWL